MVKSMLPSSYQDEIKLNEKLSDSELQAKIHKIEDLRRDAAKYFSEWKKDIAKLLTQEAHQFYAELKGSYPVYQELKDQWKKLGEDVKNVAWLEAEIADHKAQTELLQKDFNKKKEEFEQSMQVRNTQEQEKQAKLKDLQKKLNPATHTAYRNGMVDYAKEHDRDNAERIEKRAMRVEELRIKWVIKEDADGVSFGGLKTASKAVQEKALQDAFGDKLQSSYWRDDHQGEKSWTKKVFKKDLDAHGDQFDKFALWSMEQLDTMRAWIRENFEDVKTQDDELYILQMINPDLFEWMWMKDVDWNYRSCLRLDRDVSSSYVFKYYYHNDKAGLFLVQSA